MLVVEVNQSSSKRGQFSHDYKRIIIFENKMVFPMILLNISIVHNMKEIIFKIDYSYKVIFEAYIYLSNFLNKLLKSIVTIYNHSMNKVAIWNHSMNKVAIWNHSMIINTTQFGIILLL